MSVTFVLEVFSALVPPFSRNARSWPKGGGKSTLLRLALGNVIHMLNARIITMGGNYGRHLPLVAFGWDTLVFQKVGPDPLNKFLQNLRNSKLPQSGYFQLRIAIVDGLRGVEDLPRYCWKWDACIRQFRISDTLTRGELTTIVRRLELGNFDATWLLAGTSKTRAANWATTPEFSGADLLW